MPQPNAHKRSGCSETHMRCLGTTLWKMHKRKQAWQGPTLPCAPPHLERPELAQALHPLHSRVVQVQVGE